MELRKVKVKVLEVAPRELPRRIENESLKKIILFFLTKLLLNP